MAHDKDDTRFKFASMLFGYKYFIINAIWFSDLSKLRFFLGCETSQNMHLSICSRIFAKKIETILANTK